jgi:hypothetical protein
MLHAIATYFLHPKYKTFNFFNLKFDNSFYFKNFVQTELNLSYFCRTFINKSSHNKKNEILHEFLNKTNNQIWC